MEVTDPQEESRTFHEVMSQSWRHQHEFMFALKMRQVM